MCLKKSFYRPHFLLFCSLSLSFSLLTCEMFSLVLHVFAVLRYQWWWCVVWLDWRCYCVEFVDFECTTVPPAKIRSLIAWPLNSFPSFASMYFIRLYVLHLMASVCAIDFDSIFAFGCVAFFDPLRLATTFFSFSFSPPLYLYRSLSFSLSILCRHFIFH